MAAEFCRKLAALSRYDALAYYADLIDSPIGEYYSVLARNVWGSNDPSCFDIAGLYDKHKPRALLSIAQGFRHHGDLRFAYSLTIEALKHAEIHSDLATTVHGIRELAVLRSLSGDHRTALALLSEGMPRLKALARSSIVFATQYGDYHNSIAVELTELGRFEEANGALSVALASPFADAYPEWHETLAGLISAHGRGDALGGSTVYLGRAGLEPARANVFKLAPRADSEKVITGEPGRLLDFQARLAMVKQRKESTTQSEKETPLSKQEKEMNLLRQLIDRMDADVDEAVIDRVLGILNATEDQCEKIDQILKSPKKSAK